MLCCGFKFIESKGKTLRLHDVDGGIFIKVIDVWQGKGQEMELDELQQLARVADQFQITEVHRAVEDLLIGQLNLDMCG
jgi:hypothetical protein